MRHLLMTEPMPVPVIEIRGEICGQCATPCARQRDGEFHRDPCAECPISPRGWGRYGQCENFGLGETVTAPGDATIRAVPADPTALELAGNFTEAMTTWAMRGFPVVDEVTYRARSVTCEGCEMWDGVAWLGLGKCKAPGCGCTRLKRWLSTEKCPLKKWAA